MANWLAPMRTDNSHTGRVWMCERSRSRKHSSLRMQSIINLRNEFNTFACNSVKLPLSLFKNAIDNVLVQNSMTQPLHDDTSSNSFYSFVDLLPCLLFVDVDFVLFFLFMLSLFFRVYSITGLFVGHFIIYACSNCHI